MIRLLQRPAVSRGCGGVSWGAKAAELGWASCRCAQRGVTGVPRHGRGRDGLCSAGLAVVPRGEWFPRGLSHLQKPAPSAGATLSLSGRKTITGGPASDFHGHPLPCMASFQGRFTLSPTSSVMSRGGATGPPPRCLYSLCGVLVLRAVVPDVRGSCDSTDDERDPSTDEVEPASEQEALSAL